jgi:predicted 3-demethylubiquinone-9 3-methyltransferase (glyoxalase superfamily)
VIPDRLVDMLADEDPEKVQRTTEAMLAMGKLDIATRDKAYAGELAGAR